MKIVQKYSHLNGEEYLIVHHLDLYQEIKGVIDEIKAEQFKIEPGEGIRNKDKVFYNTTELTKSFKTVFSTKNWEEKRYQYYVTLDRALIKQSLSLPIKKQKEFLMTHGDVRPILSHAKLDLVKDKVALEVQFNQYAFVAHDIFVKQMLFYHAGLINLGIEILPTKNMQLLMSSGIAYFEGEVYNVMRHGRNNPPVPLLILGVEP